MMKRNEYVTPECAIVEIEIEGVILNFSDPKNGGPAW